MPGDDQIIESLDANELTVNTVPVRIVTDPVEVLPTAELDPAKRLAPDGLGGLQYLVDGGETDHAEYTFQQVFSSWITTVSDDVPWDNESFETNPAMHDNTIADSGTATGVQTATTLQDTSKAWTPNQWVGYSVFLDTGTGAGRWRTVLSNTANTLTFATAWVVLPVSGSTTYQISKRAELVVPHDGIWEVNVQIAFSKGPAATTLFGIYVYINGAFRTLHFNIGSTVTEHSVPLKRSFNLTAGDIVTIRLYQGSGSELQVFASGFRTYVNFSELRRL